MSDEFDDMLDAEVLNRARPRARLRESRPARLVSRLYAANAPLRARILACLLRPLSPLGVAAVAAGAFASQLQNHGGWTVVDDVSRYTNDQIQELVRFVEQVSPGALQQVADLITSRPVGMAAFSASAALLLMRALQQRGGARSQRVPQDSQGAARRRQQDQAPGS